MLDELEKQSRVRNLLLREYADDDAWEYAVNGNPTPEELERIRTMMRRLAHDPGEMVRNTATEALAEIGTSEDLDLLISLTKDKKWIVRASAYSSLAALDLQESVPVVQAGIHDRHMLVRRYAAVALYDLIGCEALPGLISNRKLFRPLSARVALAYILAACGDERALEDLRILAANEDPHVGSPAKESLKEIEGETTSSNRS
jgi:HEAT repeat protein